MVNFQAISIIMLYKYILFMMIQLRVIELSGERQEAQILKFNAPPPTHLVCHVHLIANFLSFHMRLVVVVNCGA